MKTLIPIICPSIVDPVDWLFSNLATLLASHSKLRSLDIKTTFRYAKSFDSVGSLHQLFPSLSTRPRLLHLSFDSCPILFDEVTLHSLSYLTSFKLLHTRYKNLDASSPSDIWKAFVASGIHLQELEHDTITNSLLDYLLTYSGLKKLCLTYLGSDELILAQTYTRFFTDVLPNHQETLEELKLTPRFECQWCFGINNSFTVAKCTKLKHLSACVFSSQVGVGISGQSGSPSDDVIVGIFAYSCLIDLPLTRLFAETPH